MSSVSEGGGCRFRLMALKCLFNDSFEDFELVFSNHHSSKSVFVEFSSSLGAKPILRLVSEGGGCSFSLKAWKGLF